MLLNAEDSGPQQRIVRPVMLTELRLKSPDLIHIVGIINILLILQKTGTEAWRK